MIVQTVLPPHASVVPAEKKTLRPTATSRATLVRDIHPFSKVIASSILSLHYGDKNRPL
jgi:hypothetical protein